MSAPRPHPEAARPAVASPAWWERLAPGILPAITALLIAAVVGDVLILSFGQAPGDVFRLLLDGTWGNSYEIGRASCRERV